MKEVTPRNTPPQRSKSTPKECSRCNYALAPNTGRCTNFECPHYRRESGVMTAAQLVHEYQEPRLFNGRRWGSWTLDTKRLCLVFEAEPVWREAEPSRYRAYLGHYEIDLERIGSSATVLDWIFQIRGKTWATPTVLRDLINALHDILDPQANLCSGAIGGCKGMTIARPGEFIRRQIATVGKDSK